MAQNSPIETRTSRMAYCSKSPLPSSANWTNRFQSISSLHRNSGTPRLCVHLFDPFSAECGSCEWIRKVLRLSHNLVAAELHDAPGVGRLAVEHSSRAPKSRSENSILWAHKKLFRLFLRVVVSRIVFRAEVFQSKRPHCGYLGDVLAGFRPVEMVRVARKNDHGAGRIGFQLTRVEFITQSDIKDAGNHGIDSILRVLVRHQLLAVGNFDSDGVGAGLRGLTHGDRQPDGRWERREGFPIDIF